MSHVVCAIYNKKRKPKHSDLDKTGTKIYGVVCFVFIMIVMAIVAHFHLEQAISQL